jgi:hypothetical protein
VETEYLVDSISHSTPSRPKSCGGSKEGRTYLVVDEGGERKIIE